MGRGDTEAGGIPQVKPRRGLAWGLVSSFPSPETQALNPAVPCVSRVSESLALSRVVGHTLLSSPLSGGLCHCPWVTGECGAQEGGFRMCWVWIPNSGRLERKVPCLFFPRLGFSCSAPTCHEPQMGFWWGGGVQYHQCHHPWAHAVAYDGCGQCQALPGHPRAESGGLGAPTLSQGPRDQQFPRAEPLASSLGAHGT